MMEKLQCCLKLLIIQNAYFRLPQPRVSFHMDEINKLSLKIKLFC
jgi:hypothetical protein